MIDFMIKIKEKHESQQRTKFAEHLHNHAHAEILPTDAFKVTRPSFFGGIPSYFEALWYPHLYFYRKSNT